MAANFIYQLQLLREQELHELKTVWLVAIQENQIHILAANRNLQIVRQQIKLSNTPTGLHYRHWV